LRELRNESRGCAIEAHDVLAFGNGHAKIVVWRVGGVLFESLPEAHHVRADDGVDAGIEAFTTLEDFDSNVLFVKERGALEQSLFREMEQKL
jgi:hypothetical protein